MTEKERGDLLRQVTSLKMFNSYELFYDLVDLYGMWIPPPIKLTATI
jgi:hypothetical protein